MKVVHVHNPGDNWLIYNEADDIDDELLYREHVANVTVSKLERYLSRPLARLFDQTYVAFGRVRDRGSVCVLVRPERKVEDVAYIRNIVYPPLLSRL